MIFLKIFLHDERDNAVSRTDFGEKLKHLKAFIRGLENNEYKIELVEFDDFSGVRKTDASFDRLLKEKRSILLPFFLSMGNLFVPAIIRPPMNWPIFCELVAPILAMKIHRNAVLPHAVISQ